MAAVLTDLWINVTGLIGSVCLGLLAWRADKLSKLLFMIEASNTEVSKLAKADAVKKIKEIQANRLGTGLMKLGVLLTCVSYLIGTIKNWQ
jgi:hypothetical protein